MKIKIFCLILAACFIQHICAQENTNTKYLLVRITSDYDYAAKKEVYVINAESGCSTAAEIYNLKKFKFKSGAENTGGLLYEEHKDTTTAALYNYFISPTAALNFLSDKGWSIVSVYQEISSSYNNQMNGAGELVPVTSVYSQAVYCLKK